MTEPACTCIPGVRLDGEAHAAQCQLRKSAVLPAPGDPIVFGEHRLSASEAATAPAFRVETPAQADDRYQRELRAWAKREGVPLPVPPEAQE